MDRGAWWAAVRGITKSWTRLKRLSRHAHMGHWCSDPWCVDNSTGLGLGAQNDL